MHKHSPIHVTQPSLPPLDDLLPALQQIWHSKILTNGGPFHDRFESALAEYLGVEHVSLFTNCTIGLIVALQALELQGEVITTPFSFVATAHSLLWNRLKPVFVDVDEHTLNLDPRQIESAIGPETVAIMPVHCYGQPCDVVAIGDIARRHGLKVIYDAAHAFGVRLSSGSLFDHGDMSVLSFHATKVFNTFEGGAVISADAHLKARVDRLRNFGFVDEGTIDLPGLNGKMSEFNAALGLQQLKVVGDAIARRAAIAAMYRDGLSGVLGVHCMPETAGHVPNHAYFPIRITQGFPLQRDQLHEWLQSHGIYARRYFHPLISSFRMYNGLESAHPDRLRVASRAAEQVICLPIYPALTNDEARRIISLIEQAGH
ncbi:DegT/DnrJ/EryC1/StrS family aminotransferase [Castellaniella sp.]|uniref:DegT/DnrJ/EryC1/StrS family aminotransferase n=1 Tax=Castellaniella sp. TaxID=1955812 RepID=UPI00355E7BF1